MHSPPAANEFEFSLFGPGVGECAVVHLGLGEWLVVDSCLGDSGAPIAIEYLERIGVDVGSSVRLVVITHWHDDHIEGVSSIAEACPNADVWCSAALCQKEFFQLVVAASRLRLRSTHMADLSEHSRLYSILQKRAPRGARPMSIGPHLALEGMCLYRRSVERPAAEVHALSPSSATQTLSQFELAQAFEALQAGRQRRRIVCQRPNALSVALWVEVGGVRTLLGADLETGSNPLAGWHAVLALRQRPPGRAVFYKVAHHGSENADHDLLWTQMLSDSPFCGVTPFASGVNPRPGSADIRRLKSRTPHLYCTGSPAGTSPPKRDPAVERTLRDIVLKRRVLRSRMGHVRFRWHAGTTMPSIDCFGSARRL
jgi:hypothetical protein